MVTNNNNKPFHSSGFAEAANGNHFGAVSKTSFEQRRQIDSNRQAIQTYQRSTIGNPHGVLKAKPAPLIRRVVVGQRPPRPAPIPPRRHNPFR
jgi:hypothetical protein